MSDLSVVLADYLEQVRAGRVVFDHTVRFDYLRDGVALDFWEAAPFDELVVAGHIRRNDSGQPMEVTR